MKKIFVFIGALLMITMMIPQTQAANWKTYEDPEGKFSMKYPANWELMSVPGIGVMITSPDSDKNVMIMADPTGSDVPTSEEEMLAVLRAIALAEDSELEGKLKTIKVNGKPAIEYRDPEEGMVVLFTFAKSGNASHSMMVFTFTADPDQFKSACKNYFDPMIKSIKLS